MPLLLDLKIRAYHVVRCYIITVGGICDDRPCSGALRTAYHIDREVVLIKVFHKLNHRTIGVVDVSHVVEALGIFLSKFHCVIVEFFNGHPGIGLCEISRQLLICCIAGLDGGSHLLQFIRYPLRMIDEAVLDEHHRIVVGIIGLAGERPVHVKYRDPVLHGDEIVFVLCVCDLCHIVPKALCDR